MSRLYVLTHEIIELEDYEQVPSEGTEIAIVGQRCGLITAKRADDFHPWYMVVGASQAFDRIRGLERGLRRIIAKYDGFTSAKEMMQIARETVDLHSGEECSPADAGVAK
jgi:hypothetical protein